MLRISLIIAVIAGIAALVISQLQVASKIETLQTDLTSTQQQLQTAQQAESAARRKAEEATANATQAIAELETTKTSLATMTDHAETQERRASEAETRLTRTTQERNEAQAQLVRWEAFGQTIEQIQTTMGENRRLVTERDAIASENRILSRNLAQVQSKLDYFEGKKTKVQLRSDLRGRVVAVDPKYEFVVLDVGADQGALERGEMLINRSGRLVAKVRILSVQPQRSIANVLPEWKQGEIMEGDTAIVGL